MCEQELNDCVDKDHDLQVNRLLTDTEISQCIINVTLRNKA